MGDNAGPPPEGAGLDLMALAEPHVPGGERPHHQGPARGQHPEHLLRRLPPLVLQQVAQHVERHHSVEGAVRQGQAADVPQDDIDV